MTETKEPPKPPQAPPMVSNSSRVVKYVAILIVSLVLINAFIIWLRYMVWIPDPTKIIIIELVTLILAVFVGIVVYFARKANFKPMYGINSGERTQPITKKEANLIAINLIKTEKCDYPLDILDSYEVAWDIGKEGSKTPIYVARRFLDIDKEWVYVFINMLNPYNRNSIRYEKEIKDRIMEEAKLLAEHPESEQRKITIRTLPDGSQTRVEEVIPSHVVQYMEEKAKEDI